MAYKKSTDRGSIADILARSKGESPTVQKSVVYSTADISRAKTVLDRLLAQANSCEVSSIRPTVHEIEE